MYLFPFFDWVFLRKSYWAFEWIVLNNCLLCLVLFYDAFCKREVWVVKMVYSSCWSASEMLSMFSMPWFCRMLSILERDEAELLRILSLITFIWLNASFYFCSGDEFPESSISIISKRRGLCYNYSYYWVSMLLIYFIHRIIWSKNVEVAKSFSSI